MSKQSGPAATDAELLRAVADGERDAFEAFYRRHAPWLVSRLRYRCADETLVDDAVQETFLAIWRRSATYRESATGDVAGWLWRVSSRRLVDGLRQRASRDRLHRLLGRVRGRVEPSPEEEILGHVEHGDVGGSLARLSPELRAVVQATIIDGLSTREAAVLLNIPVGTVKTRAMRARRQLREELA